MLTSQQLQYGGFCSRCQTTHTLSSQYAIKAAQALSSQLSKDKTIAAGEPEFSTDILFGQTLGQMFGVMAAQDTTGAIHIFKAFSGQFNGHYRAPGWVPPLFDVEQFHRINTPEEKQIKALTKRLEKTSDPAQQQTIKQERRSRSRILMQKIHNLYILRNFRGNQKPMSDLFPQDKGIPTGTGDCCAPKLIHYAIHHKLTPLGIAEFYFGHENKSKTRQHNHFYPSCISKCAPILGFMLCGLDCEN